MLVQAQAETEAEGRLLAVPVQNVSLVITYTGMVVAVLMFAGFLYVSLNFGRRRSGFGYSYDQDYYQDYPYSKRSPGKGFYILFLNFPKLLNSEPSALSDLLEYLHHSWYDEEEEGE